MPLYCLADEVCDDEVWDGPDGEDGGRSAIADAIPGGTILQREPDDDE